MTTAAEQVEAGIDGARSIRTGNKSATVNGAVGPLCQPQLTTGDRLAHERLTKLQPISHPLSQRRRPAQRKSKQALPRHTHSWSPACASGIASLGILPRS